MCSCCIVDIKRILVTVTVTGVIALVYNCVTSVISFMLFKLVNFLPLYSECHCGSSVHVSLVVSGTNGIQCIVNF